MLLRAWIGAKRFVELRVGGDDLFHRAAPRGHAEKNPAPERHRLCGPAALSREGFLPDDLDTLTALDVFALTSLGDRFLRP